MNVLAGRAMVEFLSSLAKPTELNNYVKMSEQKYQLLRELLRDPRRQGDRVLAAMMTNCEELGISRNNLSMVFEGFWDLYWKKPATNDLNAKKLEGWINFIRVS